MEFKFLGTKIYVSFLFAALVCFMIALDRTGIILPLIFSVLAHEAAHLAVMWITQCQPRSIRLIPASVQIIRGISTQKYGEELIAAAGPAANILIALVFLADYAFFKNTGILRISVVNFCTAAFNLLPVSGLDGGTLLSCLISRKTKDPYKGNRTVRIVTVFFGVFFFGAGVFLCLRGNVNLSLFAVALYLILCAMMKM